MAIKMINMSEGARWLGPAWWILQTLRVCNIISLLSIAASSVVMVIKTEIVNNFFFFQAFSHFITCGVALVLITSELPQPAFVREFYRRNWPIFSTVDACNRGHSLAWLGAWMAALGVWTMGSLNADGLVGKLSLPLWRLTLGSGILAVVFGSFNGIVSALFRNGPQGITVRMVREHGANVYNVRTMVMPPAYDLEGRASPSLGAAGGGSHRSNNSSHNEKRYNAAHRFSYKFTPNFSHGFKQNRVTRLFAKDRKPQISGPIIQHHRQDDDVEALNHPQHQEVSPGSPESGRGSWEAHDRASPIAPHVQRPPTALHPAYTGGARSSYYSEVSHLNRF
ncbi:hypothetical protein VSDG_00850 [Cytospora chrysosperma]|uniref:DUF7598 domain-containing protein n=1 Tax=Cytospora chrysosperma TaxID=252740 RepID=A0A423WLE8_CYTCH|nr:hypothetical protein VSDG_00850 [Valsa sordida]